MDHSSKSDDDDDDEDLEVKLSQVKRRRPLQLKLRPMKTTLSQGLLLSKHHVQMKAMQHLEDQGTHHVCASH